MKANISLLKGTGGLFRVALCLFILFTLFICAPKAQAATSTTTYKVTSTTLAVRSKTSSSSKRLGTLSKGAKVKVSTKSDGWGKITYKKKTGWIALKHCSRVTISSTKTSTSSSLGTAGRLTISSVDCSVALYKTSSQSVVDKEDAAAYFPMNGCTVIADHNYQSFEDLDEVKKGSTCKIQTASGSKSYKCIKTGTAWNEVTDMVDDNGKSILSGNSGKLVMYTCKSYSTAHKGGCWAVTYTVWA